MYIQEYLFDKKDRFIEICKRYKVKSMYVFGSSLTEKFNEQDSDIDLIVSINEPDPAERGSLLLDLWEELEVFFGRKVDMMGERHIENPYLRKSVEASKQLIYDGRGQEVLI